jgi:hypothetical protein
MHLFVLLLFIVIDSDIQNCCTNHKTVINHSKQCQNLCIYAIWLDKRLFY